MTIQIWLIHWLMMTTLLFRFGNIEPFQRVQSGSRAVTASGEGVAGGRSAAGLGVGVEGASARRHPRYVGNVFVSPFG